MVATAALLPTAVAHWAKLYSDRTSVSTAVTYLHLAGVLVGGGFAVFADREALRLTARSDQPDRWWQALDHLHGVHRWVLAGLALTFVTGLLMMFADLDTYLSSAVFWTKMGLIALLLGNGYMRVRAERLLRQGAAAGWRRLRQSSVASLVLWFIVLLAGTILTTI
jgi:hypothetical protein